MKRITVAVMAVTAIAGVTLALGEPISDAANTEFATVNVSVSEKGDGSTRNSFIEIKIEG
jgi:hypothetical protein